MKSRVLIISGFCALVMAQGQNPETQKKVAALKESMAKNQAALRQYGWTEHTDILMKGEVKNTKDNTCRYGPDGKVQKTPIGTPAPQQEMRRAKKKIVEKKVGELTDYMQKAVALIHQYVPPSAQSIQAVQQAGGLSITPGAGGMMGLQLNNYLKPGDSLTLTLNATTMAITKVAVKSYLDDQKDVVTLDVTYQNLPDGTSYSGMTVLNAPAKNLQVKVSNANYQRLAQ